MITIHICIGSACHLKGSYNIINGLQEMIDRNKVGDKVTVKAAFCLGECTKAVSVKVNDGPVWTVHEENMEKFFEDMIMKRI